MQEYWLNETVLKSGMCVDLVALMRGPKTCHDARLIMRWRDGDRLVLMSSWWWMGLS